MLFSGMIMSVQIWQPTATLQKGTHFLLMKGDIHAFLLCSVGAGGLTKCNCVVHVYECLLRASVCVCVCVCMFLNACVCLCVTDQKGAKIQYIINWVPFVLPLYMMSYTTESERSLPWPRVHEPWKADTSNPGDGSGESVMSHRTEARLVPVNLSGRPDTSATQRLAASVALHFQAPTLFFLSSCPPHRFSLNIFTFPDSESTVNSPRDSERESVKSEENVCAVCVMWLFELRATPTTVHSTANVNRRPKKNNACWWGRGGCRGTGLRLES